MSKNHRLDCKIRDKKIFKYYSSSQEGILNHFCGWEIGIKWKKLLEVVR